MVSLSRFGIEPCGGCLLMKSNAEQNDERAAGFPRGDQTSKVRKAGSALDHEHKESRPNRSFDEFYMRKESCFYKFYLCGNGRQVDDPAMFAEIFTSFLLQESLLFLVKWRDNPQSERQMALYSP